MLEELRELQELAVAPYQPKRVAIVGSHPGTRDDAPYDDPNCEIWVFNEAPNQPKTFVKRWDVCFQLHCPTIYRNPHNRTDPQHWQWLQQDHGPGRVIYMQEIDERVPNSRKYPIDSVLSMLAGFTYQRYMQTTVSYALALAILEGYEVIELYGVEMASNTEYIYQRANVGFWIGYALGRGIVVDAHCAQDMFDQPLYGYEGNLEIKLDAFGARIAELQDKSADALRGRQAAEAALERSMTPESIAKYLQAAMLHGKLRGMLQECERYAWKVRAMVEESGTAIIDRSEYEGAAGQQMRRMEKLMGEVHRTAGQIELVYNQWMHMQNPGHAQALRQTIIPAHINAGYEAGLAQGTIEENSRLAQELDKRIQAAGGERGAAAFADNNGHKTPNHGGKRKRRGR